MKIEQIYTGCLAQGAYYIESEGEAAVIDPLREVAPYIQKAERNNAKIKYVFETHFHADFVSGHLDLSKKTGAPIVYGPNADPTFEAHIAKDGEEFKLGKATLEYWLLVVATAPGATASTSILTLASGIKRRNSLKRFCSLWASNSIVVKNSVPGRNVISVPCWPGASRTTVNDASGTPRRNRIKPSLPSRHIRNSSQSDSALTTQSPIPTGMSGTRGACIGD